MWCCSEGKPWGAEEKRGLAINYLNVLKAVAKGGCLTLTVGWQIC